MSEAPELESALWNEAARLGIAVRPIVLHTGWNVGPVAAYLFPDHPVTLVDAGYDHPEAREELRAAFAAAGVELEALRRIVVTHGHADHFGCARWLQEVSGCEVLMHREDAVRLSDDRDWPAVARELLVPLGISEESLERLFGGERKWPAAPKLTELDGGETLQAGAATLRVEHRPGHSPGHIWLVVEGSGALFGGDYLLANSPTNAGLELDRDHPRGRRPMLQLYDEGLRAMAAMDVPSVFPAHGPPITNHAGLIRRRLEKSSRRTERVLDALRREGETTAMDLVGTMVGDRIRREPFGFIADVVGRLDLAWAEGRVGARRRDDGVWLFWARGSGGRSERSERAPRHRGSGGRSERSERAPRHRGSGGRSERSERAPRQTRRVVMAEAVIVATGRTPIGRAHKGSLVDERPDDLLGFVIDKVVERSGVTPADVDDVIAGCGLPHGEQGMNVARVAALLAGLPETVPGTTVNRFCASSLQAIRMAFHAIKVGEGDTYVCGGIESISRTDQLPGGVEKLNQKFLQPNSWQVYLPMGLTAENVAERYDVPREDMDRFAQQSQERAVAAQKNGFFEREIIPYPKQDGTTVDRDDGPRPDSTLERLASLGPAFKPDGGRVTAGNSCPLNDGAAAVVVMSEDKAKALGITPLVRIRASSVSGLDPAIMGVGPIEAVRKVLAQTGMSIGDVDVMELNEAFAAQVLPVCAEVGVDPFTDKLNPHGGAIALGHPFGMTGARIMTTLCNDLRTLDLTIGLETMCVGGGQGMAMIVERVS